MQKSHPLVSAIMAGILSTSLGANSMALAAAPAMEKCYGVAKAGKNDCGTKTHACAGQAATNNDPSEWIYVPKGKCATMPGGRLTGPSS